MWRIIHCGNGTAVFSTFALFIYSSVQTGNLHFINYTKRWLTFVTIIKDRHVHLTQAMVFSCQQCPLSTNFKVKEPHFGNVEFIQLMLQGFENDTNMQKRV